MAYYYGNTQQQQQGYSPGPPPGISPDMWNWFQTVDEDHSGKITVHELQKALINGNWSPFNEETCRLMVGMFDRDRSGTIDIYEFSTLWNYIQEWKKCFDSFDTDRSGTIDASELNRALTTFGYRLSPQFSQMVIRRFDHYGRNCIQFDGFIQSCVMLHCLTNAFRQKDRQNTGVIQLQYEEYLQMVIDTTITK